MAGLNLIQSYLSSSEESADEDVQERNDTSVSKGGKNPLGFKLPVPDSILSLQGAKHHEDVSDDPTLHDGRIRSFKHERGNWATLVYVEYLASDVIKSWVREIGDNFGSGESELKPFSEFHLSLTKSLVLKFHWIESFVEGLRLLCQRTDRILIELSDLKVYCNEDRTRTFIGIRCEDRSKRLQEFVYNIDKLLAEYRLPPFYEEASFHVSITWCLGDAEKTLSARLNLLNESLSRILAEDISHSFIQVDNVNCKIGNKMYTFNLK